MKNIKVSMKLMVGFGIMILLAAIIGIVGIVGMKYLDDASSELYDSNLVAVKAMGNLRESFANQRNDLRAILLNIDNPDQVNSTIAKFNDYDKLADENFTLYESTIKESSKEEEQDYYSAKEAWYGAFADMKKEFFISAKAGDIDGANTAMLNGGSAIAPITTGFAASAELNGQWALDTNIMTETLYSTLFAVMIIVMVIAVVVACVLALYISGLISKPLIALNAFMQRAGARGDITISQVDEEIIGTYAQVKDEIGQCIDSTAQFVVHLTRISKNLQAVANGDLTSDITVLSSSDVMGISLKQMTDNLNSMFSDIRAASDQVSSGAGQVSQGAQQLASGSSQQAASIEELSASLSELQEKTNHNAEDSSSAREANNKTAKGLDESIRSMSQMLEAMKGIDESSASITKVIKVIDDIAFQTNILALNAAVEAARAGQHGKGFAVVADEVRNLAAKSAEAAKETSSLIEGSTERVREGNEIVAKTNANLETAVENAKESTRLIEQVANASTGQASSIVEINQGMEQISTVVQANSATAEQSAAASEEMSAQAVVMNEIVAKFKLRQSENKSIGAIGQRGSNEHTESTGFSIAGSKY